MKIYLFEYKNGSIEKRECEVRDKVQKSNSRKFYEGWLGRKFHLYEEGIIIEYSLGDIRVWITEMGDLELVRGKLVKYAINFHEQNVKMLENKALNHRAWLQPLYEMRDSNQ